MAPLFVFDAGENLDPEMYAIMTSAFIPEKRKDDGKFTSPL